MKVCQHCRWLAAFALAVLMTMNVGCDDDDKSPCEVSMITNQLAAPYGILPDGNDYLVTGGGRVDRVTRGGAVTTVAMLTNPSGSGLLRKSGVLYALDNPPGNLLRMDASFAATQIATGLQNPVDMDLDGDDFIVSDYDNRRGPPGGPAGGYGRLLRIKPSGDVQVITGTGLGGTGAVSVQPDGYFVTDFDGGRLLRVAKDTGAVSEVAVGLGNPVGIRFHRDAFYVTDFAGASSGGRLLRITKTGTVSVLEVAGLGAAAGLAIDGEDLLVTDLIGGQMFRVASCME